MASIWLRTMPGMGEFCQGHYGRGQDFGGQPGCDCAGLREGERDRYLQGKGQLPYC